MSVRYTLKPSDYLGLTRYVYLHDPRQRSLIAGAPLIVFAGLLAVQRYSGAAWDQALGWAATVTAAYVVFIFVTAWAKVRGTYARVPREYHVQEMELTDRGVEVRTPRGSSVTDWKEIVAVARDGNAIYLFVSSRAALIVPLRAFASPADAGAFMQYAAGRQQSAR
jgi:hypothetical protein